MQRWIFELITTEQKGLSPAVGPCEKLCRMLRIIHWMDGRREDMLTDAISHWSRLTQGCCLPQYIHGSGSISSESRRAMDLLLWVVREDLGEKARNRRCWKLTAVWSWCYSNGWRADSREAGHEQEVAETSHPLHQPHPPLFLLHLMTAQCNLLPWSLSTAVSRLNADGLVDQAPISTIAGGPQVVLIINISLLHCPFQVSPMLSLYFGRPRGLV